MYSIDFYGLLRKDPQPELRQDNYILNRKSIIVIKVWQDFENVHNNQYI